MHFDIALAHLVGMLLAGVRIVVWLSLTPPFGYRAFPIQVKTLLATALAMVVQPDVPPELLAGDFSQGQLIMAVAHEVLIGGALGFLCLAVYLVVQAAGNIVDMLGGFMMAFTFDPQLGSGVSTMGRFYHLTSLALLFATNSHLLILRGLLATFELVPVGGTLALGEYLMHIRAVMGDFVATALQIAGPLVAVLFLADVGLGLLSRIAPQLNVLMLAFPMKVGITLLLVAACLSSLPSIIIQLTDVALRHMAQVVTS